ncbi:ABC transporter ATP-binding protein [Haematomicrobium sanguinis]|uniref:ABC transporter ATP-binding protein n=1 Tax=Haematomicrobium sanguinis TaxID=479106 RepID=UPI0005539A8D|nr:ABC transporter ATP-binding protein [Haematomicrobium sanguinis]
MSNAIAVAKLTKNYGKTRALDGISFEVPNGAVFGVIGPNGAGKTTTMRVLLDIIRPTGGTAEVLGSPAHGAPSELRRRIGFLPGELRLDGRLSGKTLLKQFAEISGPVKPDRVNELAERLNLDLSRPVRKLSKGNKQKLGIIQAFMHEPDLLILDEPTSGLDPLMQQEFLNLVHQARENGQSVFLSSHVLSEIQSAADQVAILRNGQIVDIATVDALREAADRTFRVRIEGLDQAALEQQLGSIDGVTLTQATTGNGGGKHAADGFASATGTLTGSVKPLIDYLATQNVDEASIQEPDLEQSVLKLYNTRVSAGGDE